MKKILFIFLLVITTSAINAQTIYHYQKVANVNPDTGEKTAYYGNAKLHCIFYSNGNILQQVKENGEKNKDLEDGELKSGIYFPERHYYSGNRNFGEYSLIKNENNILTYKHYHEDTSVISSVAGSMSNTINYTFYIYLSLDKKKLNLYHPDFKKEPIEVYELYDTDDAGSIPQSKKMDPNNPTMLY